MQDSRAYFLKKKHIHNIFLGYQKDYVINAKYFTDKHLFVTWLDHMSYSLSVIQVNQKLNGENKENLLSVDIMIHTHLNVFA